VHVMQQWPDRTRIDELTAFATVAEHRSFSKAARTLGRDPTVLSRRISALERRLGVRLLERTTRQVALTEAGATLLARAQTIRTVLTDAEQEIAAYASGEPRGILKVALPTSFGRMWVAPYLSAFFRAYPQVRVEAAFSNRFVDLVGEGFDAAVRLGSLADSRLIARKIAVRRRLVCASPAFLDRYGIPARPEMLGDLPCLGFTGFAFHPNWQFTSRSGEQVVVATSGPLVTDDAEVLVQAAVEGVGIMLSADWLVGRELQDGRLVPVLQDWSAEEEGAVYVVVPSVNLLAAKTRAFVDWIASRYAPIPPWSRWSGLEWSALPRPVAGSSGTDSRAGLD
jgi:DNA-binding transcriptional LysR family regulator